MSRTIDEKVVEMRFDNSDFERNVSQSMSTLDKLKGALDFSGASKAFDGITSAANKVSFGGLTSALDGVGEKFSALETIATGALLNIGRKVEDFVTNQVKSLTLEPVMQGFDKYASKTSSVQMIMNAIRDGTKSDTELMEEVNSQLERLMWYTDETSYDFTEMVASIGKFTSVGIGLEESVTAMEGIANLAGISGATKAEANRAMYNISQALSGGYMRLQDWASIKNANMATKEFREMLIQSAINRGTLEQAIDEAGNIIYGVTYGGGFNEVNYKTVDSTLTQGKWLTNEVLTDTLALYGAFTDELSKVYDDINENADVTTSQIIKMTNQWKDGTLDMSEAIAMTGKSAEELEAIFASLGRDEYDLGRRAFAAAQEAKTFREAIDATKDAVSTGWMRTFELLFGNYEEAKVLWTDLSNELWEIFAGPISDINDVLTAWRNNDDLGDGREDLIEGLKNIYRAAKSVVDPITEAWEAIFPSATYKDIWNFTHRFKEFTDRLILSKDLMGQVSIVFEDFFKIFKTFSDAFKDSGGFSKFFEGIGGILKNGTDRVYDFILSIQKVRSAIEALETRSIVDFGEFQRIMNENSGAAKFIDIYEKIIKTVETLGQTFGKLFDFTTYLKDGALTLDSIISGIEFRIATILSSASEIIHLWTGIDFGKTFGDVRAILFGMLDGLRDFLTSERWSEVKYAITGIATAVKDTFGPAWQAAVTIFGDWIAGIRSLIDGADRDFSGFFDTVTRGAYQIASFIRSLKGGVEFISDFLVKFLSLTDAINTYRENGGGIVGVLAVVHEKLKIILDTVFDIIQNVTGLDLHGVGDGIISVIESIERAVLQVADTIAKAFGWNNNPFGKLLGVLDEGLGGLEGNGFDLSGIFNRIGDAFSRLGELVNKVAPGVSALLGTVGDAFKNLWELIGQIRLEDLIMIFQGIASIALMFQAKNTLAELGDTLEAYQKKLKADMLFAIAGAILMIAGAALLISKIDADKIGLVLGTLGAALAILIGTMVASKWADPRALAALPGAVLAIAAAMVILAKAAEMMTGPIQAFADMENFWSGMEKLGTVMGSFLILLSILGGINSNGKVLGAAKALGKLAVVLAVMLPITLAYSKIDWGSFGDGLGKAALGIMAMGAALGVVSEFERWTTSISHKADFMSLAKSLLVLSAAIGVLTAVMFALTKLDSGEYFASLGKMLGILAVAAGGVWLFSKALTAFGETMFILDKTGAMKALDRFSTVLVKLGTAILMLTVGTLGLGLIAKLLGDSAQEIAEAGVNLIVVVLDAIVARTPEIAEDIVLFIYGVLEAVAGHTPEIVSACVRILGGIAEGIKDAMENGGIDLGEILGGGGILAGLLGITWLLKKAKLGVKDFFNAGLALVGAAALLAEIGALFYGMGQLSDLVGGPAGLEKFAKFGEALTSALMGNKGGVLIMVLSLIAMVGIMSAVIGKLNLKEKDMASSIGKAFLVLGQVFGEVIGLLDEVGLLFAATGFLLGSWSVPWIKKAEELYVAIANVFGENGGVYALFAAAITLIALTSKFHISASKGAFGDIVIFLAEAVGIIDALGALFAATGFLIEVIEMLPNVKDGAVVIWVEKAGDLFEAIGAAIGKLVGGLVGGIANGTIKEATKGVTTDMIDLIKGMGECLKVMSEAGLIAAAATWAGGPIGLEIMAAEMASMAPHFVEFAEGVSSLSHDTAEKAKICAEALQALIALVPETGGIKQWWNGEINIELFGKGISGMAGAITEYSSALSSMTDEDITALKNKTDRIAEVLTALKDVTPETNVGMKKFLEGANDIGTFSEKLVAFADNLKLYCEKIADDSINLVVIGNVTNKLKGLTDFAKDLGALGSEKISLIYAFGNNLYSFGDYFKKYYDTLKDVKIEKIDSLSGAVSRMIKSFVGTDETSTAGAVASMTGDFLNKLVEAFGGTESKKKSEEAADKFIDYFRDRFLWDGTITKISLAIQNMINKGIYNEELVSGLKTGGSSMVETLQEGITEAFESEGGLNAKFASFLEALATSIATDGQGGSKKKYYDAGAALTGALRNGMVNEEATSGFGTPPAKQLKDDFKGLLDSLIGMIVSEEMKGQFQRGGASLINSLIGGMKGVDVASETAGIGKNATLGVANGMIDEAAMTQVKTNAAAAMKMATDSMAAQAQIKSPSRLTALYGWYLDGGLADGLENGIPMVIDAVGTVVDETKEAFTKSAEQGGFDIHSNSWLTTLFGRFLDGGLADGMIDGIPVVKEAINKVKQAVKDGMGINDLASLLEENGLGALEDKFASYISQFGADFNVEGTMSDFSSQYTSYMSDIGTNGMEEFMAPYMDGTYVNDGISVMTENVSDSLGVYNTNMYDFGSDGINNYYDGIGDNAISAAQRIAPTISSASELVAEAATGPIADGMANILSYADWLAEKYPEGVTQALSAPVYDFSNLYDSMKGGQLEAVLSMFDSLNDRDRSNLIRSYGLGENGGSEDLANYLQWYWKNEPIRMQNEEAIAQAQAGYQTYLEEQKSLEEAQLIQQQENYAGVQQIAADMQMHTDEFNAKYLAVVEEIKMNVIALREELDGVQETLGELNDMDVYIDSNALVGATAEKYNEELGNMAKIGRRNVTR